MSEKKKVISFKLTPHQAGLVWGVLDGAIDAGACSDGLTEAESEACEIVASALLQAARQEARDDK